MPIRVECASCRASFHVGEENAGRRGKCPRCKEPFRVPPAPPTATSKSEGIVPAVESADDVFTKADTPVAAKAILAVKAEESASTIGSGNGDVYALADAPIAGATARLAAVRGATATQPARDRAPKRPSRTPAEVLAAFRGEIRPVRPTPLYRAWILVVALVMLLLPAAYVALIASAGYGLFLHAVHDVVVFENVRNARGALLLYVGPLVVGAIVIAFMLKPLFAKPSRRSKVRKLDPSKEPLVFAFVDSICRSVGAPTPARIEVDCRVNASAHLASGPLSPSRELVLTIGLPLVEGLSLRQFAGVLSHEFGHFAQGAGMRLSRLIWSVNAWFARVVYDRDEWDETLVAWSREGNIWSMIIVAAARVAVWLTRRVLWVLMQVGRVVSGFLSRQMEYDADRYEARMVGGPVFAETMRRIGELGLAEHGALAELEASWRERRLPDDLPRLIVSNVDRIPGPIRDRFLDAMQAHPTGLFDTHPADRDRLARARAEAPEGIFTLDGPAADLFRDFDALARAASFDHYRAVLGRDITKDQLYPLRDALLDREVAKDGQEAFERFFLDDRGRQQPLPMPPEHPTAPADLKAAKRALVEARAAMLAAREASRAALERREELDGQAAQAAVALALLKAGNKLKAGEYGLDRATQATAEAARDRAASAIRGLAPDLAPFADAAARRLAVALGLLESDAVASRVPDGALRRDEARALYPCAAHLSRSILPELGGLTTAAQTTADLIRLFQAGKNDRNEPLINAVLRGGRQLHERLTELKWKLGDALPYPFEHAKEGISLSRYALPSVPDSQAVGELLGAGGEAHERILALHRRILGRLASTCEAVERALGLPPLLVPEADWTGQAGLS